MISVSRLCVGVGLIRLLKCSNLLITEIKRARGRPIFLESVELFSQTALIHSCALFGIYRKCKVSLFSLHASFCVKIRQLRELGNTILGTQS